MVHAAWTLAALLTALAMVPALAAGPEQAACADAPAPEPFAASSLEMENLAFDGAGNLYVNTVQGTLLRFTSDGASVPMVEGGPSFGGIAFGPEGELYIGAGVGFAVPVVTFQPAYLTPLGAGEVWRFDDPANSNAHTVYARSLDSVNGMVADSAGNLYVSEGFDVPILRIPPGGVPEAWTHTLFPNGLTIAPDGQGLYAALTLDPLSRIVRIPFDAPQEHTTVATLGVPDGPTPKTLDDLVVAPDGNLYVTAHLVGEVLRVDLATGAACVFATLDRPSSVAVAQGFGPYDGDLFVTSFTAGLTRIPMS